MRSLTRRSSSLLVALTLSVTLGLAACTGGGSSPDPSKASGGADAGSGQTTAEACELVQSTINDATANFQDTAQSDPSSLVTAMEEAARQLAETAPQVTNEEVAALLPDLQSMFEQAGEVMDAIAQNDTSRLDELNALGENFQETTQQFQELCVP